MSIKKTLIRLLDRGGGRFLLGKIATHALSRMGGEGVEISYIDGLWTRRVGADFFPDSSEFTYAYADFDRWKSQMEEYFSDTNEYWLQHYSPKEGDVIVDVGAGRGEDTITFSRLAGPTGRVIAIEAHPRSFAVLKSFCHLNGLNNVIPIHMAVLDRGGKAQIVESKSSWMEDTVEPGGGLSGLEVRAGTLSEVIQEQGLDEIAFLKMNIEGAERFALPGLVPVIDRIQHICVACHDFRAEMGHGEEFRSRTLVEQCLVRHGFKLSSRSNDPRDYVRDHIFGSRTGVAKPIVREFLRPRSEPEARNAKRYVGTDDGSGRLQLELLKREGCRPESKVLEIGCGNLHAGVPLIRFLHADNYVGMDPNEWLRETAMKDIEIRRLIEDKRARFLSRDDFDASGLGSRFDFVLSHSVLSHCAHWQLAVFLRNAGRVLTPKGRILASIRLAEGNVFGSDGTPDKKDSMDQVWQYPGVSWFSFSTVERIASEEGLTAVCVPEYTEAYTKERPNECHDWLVFSRR